MILKMMIFGYDCGAVDRHVREIDSEQRPERSELIRKCLEQAECNNGLADRISEISQQLEQVRLLERDLVDRLGEQSNKGGGDTTANRWKSC